ncbi:MAG: 16S rRNA (guanine(527)-N(7))-methyltransferase RsmG [Flavobacteriales bacterium]
MHLIQSYFPEFSQRQFEQFALAEQLYAEWNQKINVVSRKDIDNLALHHFLHSLAIYKAHPFEAGSRCIDLGTGGGFPGIPLAIALPECSFTLVDSIRKKLTVAQDIANALELKNVQILNARIESVSMTAEYITGRAVESLPDFFNRARHLLVKKGNAQHGLYYLKGPELPAGSFSGFRRQPQSFPVHSWFNHPYFEEKWLWHIPLQTDYTP